MDMGRQPEILLVDDNQGDVFFTKEALREAMCGSSVNAVGDGVEAMDYLRRKGKYANAARPDLVFLDLNMPRKNGFEVLAEMKEDTDLRVIPVIILSTSEADEDICKAYNLHANCYVAKPTDMGQTNEIVKAIDSFWMRVVKLPTQWEPGLDGG